MKTLLFMLITASLLTTCSKENESSTVILMDPVDTTAQLQGRGVFSNGPYGSTMGVVKIFFDSSGYRLVLDSFSVSNGPDLHVYLSKEVQPVNFIDLGKLRSTGGRQVYVINGMPDFTEYKFALIHCQLFNHLFGSASLR